MQPEPLTNIRECRHCHLPYDWRRSPSGSLKMTYCGSLCERADLGFTIETLLGDIMRSAWREIALADPNAAPELIAV